MLAKALFRARECYRFLFTDNSQGYERDGEDGQLSRMGMTT